MTETIKQTIRKNLGYVPKYGQVIDMGEVKRINYNAGREWFSRGAMRFFGSRVSRTAIVTKDGTKALFVSSENGPLSDEGRMYSIRSISLITGEVDTIGDFRSITSRKLAWYWLKRHISEGI